MYNKPKITAAILKRKNEVQDLSVISRLTIKSSDREKLDQWNKTKCTIRSIHTQLIFNKGTKTTPRRNKSIQKILVNNWTSTCKKLNTLHHILTQELNPNRP